MDSTEAVTHISLCTGYGGIDLGLARVIRGLRTVAYAEIDAFAVECLLARMEAGQLDAAPIWTDVRDFPCEGFRGSVDILSAGYPCQPFSHAGLRSGADDPRNLWPAVLRCVGSIRPSVVFLENVEGHISMGLSSVISDLEELGYSVSWGIFSAEECGAPHIRKRVFILAHTDRERGQGSECFLRDIGQVGQGWKDSAADSDDCDAWQWPSGPDHRPKWWEPPRTIESSMGRKSAGSSVLMDRLRLLGNGVVPATAELAFRTLARQSLADPGSAVITLPAPSDAS